MMSRFARVHIMTYAMHIHNSRYISLHTYMLYYIYTTKYTLYYRVCVHQLRKLHYTRTRFCSSRKPFDGNRKIRTQISCTCSILHFFPSRVYTILDTTCSWTINEIRSSIGR